jgi:FtsH-binding integral membrane protein
MSANTPDRRPAASPGADARTAPTEASTDSGAGAVDRDTLHHDVLQREKDRFGGFKFGSAFFGWLTAMGTAVLLTALVAAIGAAVGLSAEGSVEDAADAATRNAGGTAILSAIVIGLVLFIAYFAGGYVAGRMARFSGVKQGLAVWVWAIVIAIVVAVVTAIAGSQWDILGALDGFPRIPVTPETATTTGILTAVGAAIVTLGGAILGGMAGMRYHRKVDRVGFGQ